MYLTQHRNIKRIPLRYKIALERIFLFRVLERMMKRTLTRESTDPLFKIS